MRALTSLAVDVTVLEPFVPSVIVSVTEFEVDALLTDRAWFAAAVANLIVTGLVCTPWLGLLVLLWMSVKVRPLFEPAVPNVAVP